MADFDTTSVLENLQDAISRQEKERPAVIDAIKKSNADMNTLNSTYTNTIQGVNTQVNNSLDNIGAINQTRLNIAENPPLLNDIMSMLGNEEFSDRYQRLRLQKANTELTRSSNRLDIAGKSYQANSALIKGKAAAALTQHEITREGISDITTSMNAMIQAQQLEQNSINTKLQATTTDELAKWVKQPELIPEGVPQGKVETIYNNRLQLQEELESAQLANDARNTALFEAKKKRALPLMSTIELQTANEEAAKTGSTLIQGVEFTTRELKVALTARLAEDRATLNATAKMASMTPEYRGSQITTDSYLNGIARDATGMPFDPANPQNSLPTELAVKKAETDAKIERALSLGAIDVAVEEQKKLEALAKAAIESQVETIDKEEQDAAKDWYFRNGQIAPTNAKSAIASFATDPFAVQEGPLKDIWPTMAENANKSVSDFAMTGGGMAVNLATGGIVSAPNKLPDEVLVQNMMDTTISVTVKNAEGGTETVQLMPAEILADDYLQKFLTSRFIELGETDPRYLEMVDATTGGLSADQYSMSGSVETSALNRSWNPQVTAQKMIALFEGNQTALEAALGQLQSGAAQFAQSIDRGVANNYRQASVNTMLYGNKSYNLIAPRLRGFTGKTAQLGQRAAPLSPEQQQQSGLAEQTLNVATGTFPTFTDVGIAKLLGNIE